MEKFSAALRETGFWRKLREGESRGYLISRGGVSVISLGTPPVPPPSDHPEACLRAYRQRSR